MGQGEVDLEGTPRRLFSCTPTRLNTWLDCPRRYRFGYLDRPTPPKGPPWAHNSLGASVHLALANWYRLPVPQRTPQAAGRLVVQAWQGEGFRDDAQSAYWQERARAMVEAYAETLDPAADPVGIERTLATRTPRLAFSGRVDRLDLREEDGDRQVVVVDYKTGKRPLTDFDARSSLALALYALAAARMFRTPHVRVELHHLPTGEVAGHDHTRESLMRHLGRAEAIADEAVAAEEALRSGAEAADPDALFPAQVTPACRWCDFVRVCPAATDVSPAEPWSGLGDSAPAPSADDPLPPPP